MLRATVTHPEYEKKLSDITTDLTTTETRRFVLYLKKKGCVDATCLEGTWDDDWGYTWVLGSGGSGTYSKGHVKGTVSGASFDPKTCKVTLRYAGDWYSGSKASGTAELVLSPDGRKMTGGYTQHVEGYTVPQTGGWTLTRSASLKGGCNKSP